jgi:4-hydroxybenzoate polyprenyltransferase
MSRFALRNALQRLLGPTVMGYLLHLRPLEWPIMTAHMLLGTLLAVGWHLPKQTFAAWVVFVVALNGGTLALNSAFDQDEGDIGYLKQPPKPPKHLAAFGYALLAIAFLWSMRFIAYKPGGRYFFEIVMTCVLMSIVYSVPPIRLKARAGWDLLINCAGFGFFTPLAGWTLTGRPMTPMILDLCVGFGLLFAALYPLTQIYQVEEDTRRGDSTLVIKVGVGRSLTYAIIATLGTHLWFVKACLHARVSPLPLLLSLAAWLGLLLPWRLTWKAWDAKKAESGMYRGLWAWAITDISALILLWPR